MRQVCVFLGVHMCIESIQVHLHVYLWPSIRLEMKNNLWLCVKRDLTLRNLGKRRWYWDGGVGSCSRGVGRIWQGSFEMGVSGG
jgi:hypothetical protein